MYNAEFSYAGIFYQSVNVIFINFNIDLIFGQGQLQTKCFQHLSYQLSHDFLKPSGYNITFHTYLEIKFHFVDWLLITFYGSAWCAESISFLWVTRTLEYEMFTQIFLNYFLHIEQANINGCSAVLLQ